jgi:glucoamylase
MKDNLLNKIKQKLIYNILWSKKEGMIIASPSSDPPYVFHWIRDSSLVMKAIIDMYFERKTGKYFLLIINYLENEFKIQKLNTLGGLGEPKININCTPYNDPWGRPQNDGPALRGLNMIKLFSYFNSHYSNINTNLIKSILMNDLDYLIENYNKTCFDLWEEIQGWHFYTRLVQFKFFKEFLKLNKEFNLVNSEKSNIINTIINDIKSGLSHHKSNDLIISSFDNKGDIIRWDDASIILGLCHVDYDSEIIELFGLNSFINVCKNLIQIFNEKYNDSKNLIGRYKNDKYYDGQAWFICSLAVCQFYYYLFNLDLKLYFNYFITAKQITNFIINLDKNLDLDEQYNPDTDKQMSAKQLTWNYTELYFTLKITKD